MTEQELRELDAWIAEHGFGIEVKWDNGLPVRKENEIHTWGAGMGLVFNSIPDYTSHSFREVKREIERRGWSWVSSASFDDPPLYAFHVIGKQREGLALTEAETEELAGCLAFKAAVETSDEMSQV